MTESSDDKYIKKVSKGAAISFFGLGLSSLIGYITRILLVRLYGIEDYGLFSLGNALVGIAIVISLLGMTEPLTRFYSYHKGKGNIGKMKGVFFSGLKITMPLSLLLFVVITLLANPIANRFFDDPNLEPLLFYFALMIPLSVLLTNIISAIRGLQIMKYKVYSEDISKSLVTLGGLLAFFFIGFGISGAVFSYIIGFVIAIMIGLYFLWKAFPEIKSKVKTVPMGKEILLFSWPLLISAYVQLIIVWTDTIALGYFGITYNVGLYNTALPTAGILFMIGIAFKQILTPVMSEMHANDSNLKVIFSSTNKWILSLGMPMMMLIMLFPDNILSVLFGLEAVPASSALVILSVGYLALSFMTSSLTVMIVKGKTKTLMVNTIASSIINLFLNLILIPIYGMIGAAVATTTSFLTLSFLHIITCYRATRLHPFQHSYLKIFLSGTVSVSLFYFLIKFVIGSTDVLILIAAFPVFLIVYSILLLGFKTLDDSDILILKLIEKRLGFEVGFVRKIIKRFL